MKARIILLVMALKIYGTCISAVVFYTSEALWEFDTGAYEMFTTSSENMTKANEIFSTPGFQTNLGKTLTFYGINTGLSWDFELRCLEGGDAEFVYNDHPLKLSLWPEAISVGQINQYEDDDWELNILSDNPMFAFAFDLVGNHWGPDSLSVFDVDGNLLGQLTQIPAPGDAVTFLGVISDRPIGRIFFDSDATEDDIAIANFRFAVPEPTTLSLIALGGLLLRKRKA